MTRRQNDPNTYNMVSFIFLEPLEFWALLKQNIKANNSMWLQSSSDHDFNLQSIPKWSIMSKKINGIILHIIFKVLNIFNQIIIISPILNVYNLFQDMWIYIVCNPHIYICKRDGINEGCASTELHWSFVPKPIESHCFIGQPIELKPAIREDG